MKIYTINTPASQYAAAFNTLPAYLELQNCMRENDKVFERAREIFFQVHPEVPRPAPIQCMDLVIDEADAVDILRGTRKVVYASYDELMDELYDEKVLEFEDAHWDDELVKQQLLDFTDSVRGVLNLHLHDENNTWFLDVVCEENNTVMLKNDQVKDLQDRYGFHDLDDKLAEQNAIHTEEDKRPIYFYFALTDVTNTNLE